MAFNRFRPASHFMAPHSWSNDPCGAVYIPEIKEYIFCYQWNPGTTEGGNCAWGMARSKTLVTWYDSMPAIRNGMAGSYDSLGVFSGSIVSRIVEEKRVLFLFYTSVSALPIHWSADYIEGCETQSVAFSTDFGTSWHRYEQNPLLRNPPKLSSTTGWRDPFISPWKSMSALLEVDTSTDYMMIASGEKGRGPQLHLYQSTNLLDWIPVSTILEAESGSKITPNSDLMFGMNFECASFFTLRGKDYIIAGIEEDHSSTRHSKRYTIWMCGKLVLHNSKPKFQISSHGLLDNGVLYAPHIFHDSEDRVLQLGWADETIHPHTVKSQGWAGCLTHPRELYEISQPATDPARNHHLWDFDESNGAMTTLGIRPAPQLQTLRPSESFKCLRRFVTTRSTNFEIEASFTRPSGTEKFTFNVRESPDSIEVTRLIFDLSSNLITVDRSRSSIENLGANTPDSGTFHLLPSEELHIRIFVDNSIVEIFANDRFTLSSRIYPSLEASVGVSYDFGRFNEGNVKFECWEGLKKAWPERQDRDEVIKDILQVGDLANGSLKMDGNDLVRQAAVRA